jgi:hypothetical protein
MMVSPYGLTLIIGEGEGEGELFTVTIASERPRLRDAINSIQALVVKLYFTTLHFLVCFF